jgi:methionyl-tRNA formyltransferase
MDAGDIIVQRAEPIRADDTGESLEARLCEAGAELLVEALGALDRGDAPRTPQDHAEATFAPKLTKEHGLVDWTLPAEAIERRVRAFIPWPVAYTGLPDGGLLRILEARVVVGNGEPGRVTGGHRALVVGTGRGLLELVRVQPEGRRPMTAAEFLAGHRLDDGAALGAPAGGA